MDGMTDLVLVATKPRLWKNDMKDDGVGPYIHTYWGGDTKGKLLEYDRIWVRYEALLSYHWLNQQLNLPPQNVVLDDFNMAWIVNLINEGKLLAHTAHTSWPGDFATDGLPYINRPNRGRPCKVVVDEEVYYLTIAKYYVCVGDETSSVNLGPKCQLPSKPWGTSQLFTVSIEAMMQSGVEIRMIDKGRPPSVPFSEIPVHLQKFLPEGYNHSQGEKIDMKISLLSSGQQQQETEPIETVDQKEVSVRSEVRSDYNLRPRPLKIQLPATQLPKTHQPKAKKLEKVQVCKDRHYKGSQTNGQKAHVRKNGRVLTSTPSKAARNRATLANENRSGSSLRFQAITRDLPRSPSESEDSGRQDSDMTFNFDRNGNFQLGFAEHLERIEENQERLLHLLEGAIFLRTQSSPGFWRRGRLPSYRYPSRGSYYIPVSPTTQGYPTISRSERSSMGHSQRGNNLQFNGSCSSRDDRGGR